jgi:hypothetical protein
MSKSPPEDPAATDEERPVSKPKSLRSPRGMSGGRNAGYPHCGGPQATSRVQVSAQGLGRPRRHSLRPFPPCRRQIAQRHTNLLQAHARVARGTWPGRGRSRRREGLVREPCTAHVRPRFRRDGDRTVGCRLRMYASVSAGAPATIARDETASRAANDATPATAAARPSCAGAMPCRPARAAVVYAARTSNSVSVTGPNEVIRATSTASRPRPTTTRPMRRRLLRASKVCHAPSR